MIRTLFSAVLSFASLSSALAATTAFSGPSLTLSTNNGTVAPQYRVGNTCKIEGRQAVVTLLGGFTGGHTIEKMVQFTKDVPNEVVMASLIAEASRTPPTTYATILPVGGGTTSYIAQVNAAKQFSLLLFVSDIKSLENESAASKKLVAFMDKNCK